MRDERIVVTVSVRIEEEGGRWVITSRVLGVNETLAARHREAVLAALDRARAIVAQLEAGKR